MYDGNPGEIDFCSSYREVRLSEGSSYRESTVSQYLQDHRCYGTLWGLTGRGWGRVIYEVGLFAKAYRKLSTNLAP